MKKIVGIIAAASMAASMFAVNISSTVKMDTTIAAKNGDDVNFLTVNKKDQKDSDALIFSGASDKAGGQFQFWYTFDGTDSTSGGAPVSASDNNPVRIRNVNVWFKPIDQVKVTVGNVAIDSYKEMIFWWHGVYGGRPGWWNGFGGEYIGGVGAKAEISPIAGLDVTLGFMPGIATPFITTTKDSKVVNYAAKVKYSNIAGLPISTALVWCDKGEDNRTVAIGFDYGSPWSGNFYAFANVNLKLAKSGLVGFSVDNYEKFTMNALQIQAHLPFDMYKEGDTFTPFLYASVKVTYALGAYTPYLLITNEPDGDAAWTLNKDFKFNMTFQPGVTFNVGSAGFDAAVRVDIADGKLSNWKVPVGITVGL